MTLRTYVVWESEYPDGGSTEVRALTGREAKAKYRKLTGSDADVELGASRSQGNGLFTFAVTKRES